MLAAIVVLAILAVSPWLATDYFDGDWMMVVALVAAFAAYAPAHLARGICSGSGRFHKYAVVMGTDGVVRIVLCVLLALVGVTAVAPYGFAVALAPLVGVGIVLFSGGLRTDTGPEATWSEVTPNLGWLLLGSVFAATLLNAGPIATTLLAEPGQEAAVTQFAYGVLLARIPLFMFQAVQAALLPRLSRLAARGELDEFLAGLRRLMIVVAAVGIVGTIGAYVLGSRGRSSWSTAPTCRDARWPCWRSAAPVHGGAGIGPGRDRLEGTLARRRRLVCGCRSRSCSARGCRATTCSAVSRSACYSLRSTSVTAFGLALRHRLAVGASPDEGSMLEAMTDMPLES